MSRHHRRANAPHAGFSLIELLVTIIIAGIAFAALVPVFVQAARTGSDDKAKTVALNIAQDAIENTRRMTFEQVVTSTWVQNEETQAGNKPFTVQRVVDDEAASPTDARIVSKAVEVTVTWDLPSPGSSVVLKTVLYRQTAGPQIVDFTVAPWDADNEWITDATVQLDAIINAADIESMAPVTIGGNTISGKVDFMIASVGGTVIPTISVPYDGAHPASYSASWVTPGDAGVSDGYWSFKAVAFSAQGYPGNTWQFVKRIESGPPAPVTNLHEASGLDWVSLTWSPSISSDVAYYRVVRTDPLAPGGSGVPHSEYVTGDPDDEASQSDDTAINDTGLATDATYTYAVYAVDHVGNASIEAVIVVGTGGFSSVQPAPATELNATVFGRDVKLTWEASADTDVLGYWVYKDGATTPLTSVTELYCTVDHGWDTSANYQVKPYRNGSNPATTDYATLKSGSASDVIGSAHWIRATTGVEPLFDLEIMNNVHVNQSATITLKYLGPEGSDPGVVVTPTASGVPYSTTVYGATWSDLSGGYYQFSWVTANNKSGSRALTLTTSGSGSLYQEKCIP